MGLFYNKKQNIKKGKYSRRFNSNSKDESLEKKSFLQIKTICKNVGRLTKNEIGILDDDIHMEYEYCDEDIILTYTCKYSESDKDVPYEEKCKIKILSIWKYDEDSKELERHIFEIFNNAVEYQTYEETYAKKLELEKNDQVKLSKIQNGVNYRGRGLFYYVYPHGYEDDKIKIINYPTVVTTSYSSEAGGDETTYFHPGKIILSNGKVVYDSKTNTFIGGKWLDYCIELEIERENKERLEQIEKVNKSRAERNKTLEKKPQYYRIDDSDIFG